MFISLSGAGCCVLHDLGNLNCAECAVVEPDFGDNALKEFSGSIGVTADQWAKLPPLAQKDLLNAAQQSGPPSYRQMIKDYYVRIAKMRESGAAPARR